MTKDCICCHFRTPSAKLQSGNMWRNEKRLYFIQELESLSTCRECYDDSESESHSECLPDTKNKKKEKTEINLTINIINGTASSEQRLTALTSRLFLLSEVYLRSRKVVVELQTHYLQLFYDHISVKTSFFYSFVIKKWDKLGWCDWI